MLLLMWHWDKPGFPRPGCWSVPHYQASHGLAVASLQKKEGRRPIFYRVNDVNVYLDRQRWGGEGFLAKRMSLRPFLLVFFQVWSFKNARTRKLTVWCSGQRLHALNVFIWSETTTQPTQPSFFLHMSREHKRRAYKISFELNFSLLCNCGSLVDHLPQL